MARRGGLGKGLGALIPSGPGEAAPVESGGGLEQLPLASITPNQYQPRAHFDEEELTSLDRKSTRLNSSHSQQSRMPSSA